MLSFLLATSLCLSPVQDPAPAPAPAPTPSKITHGKLPWFAGSLEKALLEAKSSNKLVFADFNAGWCTWCMKMDREVFSADETLSAMENVICVSVDYDKQRDTADRYAISRALPVALWFNPDGSVRERIDNFQSKEVFLANAARIKADIGTINDQRRAVAKNPADAEQRYELYRRLKAVGDAAGAAAERAAIEKADPQGNSRAMHHFRYDAIKDAINAYWVQSKALDPKQIEGLRNFMEVETDPEIMWDGWMSLANTYKYWGELAQQRGEAAEAKKQRGLQRESLARAWRGIPQDDDTLHAHVTFYAGQFWDLKDELSGEDKSLVLAMTEMTARRFENDALIQDLYGRGLFLNGKLDAAKAACERAIEIAKARSEDPKLYQQHLEAFGGGAK